MCEKCGQSNGLQILNMPIAHMHQSCMFVSVKVLNELKPIITMFNFQQILYPIVYRL